MLSEILISLTGNQNNVSAFLLMFFHVSFNLELLSTNVSDITSYKCFFMCKRHLKHINVKYVENISRKNIVSQDMQIKHKHILVPGRRYQDSRSLLKNPKVSKNVMGFNNHTQRTTPPYHLDVDNPFPLITGKFL